MDFTDLPLGRTFKCIDKGRDELLEYSMRQAPLSNKDDLIVDFCLGKSVLDVGFIGHNLKHVEKLGDDWLHKRIKEKASAVLGVDILEYECNVLRRKGYDNICQDVLELKIDRKFDVIVCADIIEHISNTGIFLERLRDHLAPGGVIIISTPNPFNIEQFVRILKLGYPMVNKQHTAWFDVNTLFESCSRAGLCIVGQHWVRTRYYLMPPIWPYRIIKAIALYLQKKRPYLRSDFIVVCTHQNLGSPVK